MNLSVVGGYFKDLQDQSSTNHSCIGNMDETNMCLEHKPVSCEERAKVIHGRTAKSYETVTFLPCINAAGQKICPS